MMKNKLLLLLAAVVWSIFAPAQTQEFSAPDGPYVLYTESGDMRTIAVSAEGELIDTTGTAPKQFTVLSEKGGYAFPVARHSFERPSDRTDTYPKCAVLSDPHGDMPSFVSVLQANGIIDDDLTWSFGANQLVIIGDIFDRGCDVVPIFWLVYKLEEEARLAGGRVDFLLGNHEEMVLRGDLRYLHPKYRTLSEKAGISHEKLWAEDSELGRWLRTRNTIMRVGDVLFVHAGISPEFADRGISVSRTDSIACLSLGYGRKERIARNPDAEFIFDSKGPLWYRGLVLKKEKYAPASKREVKEILRRYGVRRIVVGHTIFDEVCSFYGKRVVAINVENDRNRRKGCSRGILIEGDKIHTIHDSGKLGKLKRKP